MANKDYFASITNKGKPLGNQPANPTPSGDYFASLSGAGSGGVQQEQETDYFSPVRKIVSTIAPVVEFLSRPSYASAKFANSLANESKSIFDAIVDSIDEFIDPKSKLSYSDVIKKFDPAFAKNNPTATSILGFLGDLALDPTTYIGVGGIASKGLKVGGKSLTKLGIELRASQEAILQGKKVLTAPGGLIAEVTKETVKAEGKGIKAAGEYISRSKGRKQVKDIAADYVQALDLVGLSDTGTRNLKTGKFAKARSTQLALDELNRMGNIDTVYGYQGVIRKLAPEEVIERAEQRVSRIASISPDIAAKIFEPDKVAIKIGLPFGKQYDIPGTAQLLALGLDPLAKSVKAIGQYRDAIVGKEIPVVSKALKLTKDVPDTLAYLFKRPEDQPYKEAVTTLEKQFDFIAGAILRNTRKMFKDINPERRAYISNALREIDDTSRVQEKGLGRYLTQVEADKIYKDTFQKYTFNPDEFAVISKMQQDFKNAMEIEMEVGLLKQGITNYYPRYYQVLADPDEVSFLHKNKFGLSTFLPSSKARSFLTQQEAIAAGFVPEMDASVLYAQRILSSRRKQATAQFRESLKEIYGTDEFDKLPIRIRDDIRLLGESVYPSGMNGGVASFLKGFDKISAMFRRSATVAGTGFAGKQLATNTIQLALNSTLKAFKSFDPRAAIDAGMLLFDFYRGKPTSVLPEALGNLFSKHLGGKGADAVLGQRVALEKIIGEERLQDYGKEIEIINPFGTRFSGTDTIRLARENRVITEFDATGDKFTQLLSEALEYDPNNRWRVTKELGKFWRWPGMVENYNRMIGFTQGLRMGYSPEQAAKMVIDAQFDYQRGLTYFERNFARRIIPFYTFQRFAIPQVLKLAVRQPGNIVTTQKVVDVIGKLLVDDEDMPSDAEREILGDSILFESPRLYKGFDKNGAAKFNTLANLTPFDALSLFVMDKNDPNKIDLERTIQKSFLAALTPLIKIPLELAIGKQFFSDKVIEDAGRLGNINDTITAVIPDFIKDALSWENRTSVVTGRTTTYINPYFAYTVSSVVPVARQYIRWFDDEQSVLDRAIGAIVNSTTYKLNFKEQEQWQQLADRKHIKEVQAEMKKAILRGSKTEFEKAREDYLNFINIMKQGNEIKRNGGIVRGTGIGEGI